jgi:Tol biopolymer transport system component
MDVWYIPVTGEMNNAVQITFGPGVDGIFWYSPDATQAVFVSDRDGNNDIWVVDVPYEVTAVLAGLEAASWGAVKARYRSN